MGPNIDRCVPIQIMSNQNNLSQVDSNQVVETKDDQCIQSSILSLIAKGLNTYAIFFPAMSLWGMVCRFEEMFYSFHLRIKVKGLNTFQMHCSSSDEVLALN